MKINELKQHECGILDLFEEDKQLTKYISHNQNEKYASSYVRLTQNEYDTIFESKPSFNEKKAFVSMFRKKWNEDKGYCSLFDKMRGVRLAKSKSIDKVERRTRARQLLKQKMDRLISQARKDKLNST